MIINTVETRNIDLADDKCFADFGKKLATLRASLDRVRPLPLCEYTASAPALLCLHCTDFDLIGQ